jgi:hypothetical protein
VGPDGSGAEQVFTTGDSFLNWRGFQWSPDGEWLAISISGVTHDERGLFVMRADGTEIRRISDSLAQPISWQPIR